MKKSFWHDLRTARGRLRQRPIQVILSARRVCQHCGVTGGDKTPDGDECWVFPYCTFAPNGMYYGSLCNPCASLLGVDGSDESEGSVQP